MRVNTGLPIKEQHGGGGGGQARSYGWRRVFTTRKFWRHKHGRDNYLSTPSAKLPVAGISTSLFVATASGTQSHAEVVPITGLETSSRAGIPPPERQFPKFLIQPSSTWMTGALQHLRRDLQSEEDSRRKTVGGRQSEKDESLNRKVSKRSSESSQQYREKHGNSTAVR